MVKENDNEEVNNYGDGMSHTPISGYFVGASSSNIARCEHLEIVTQVNLEGLECLITIGADIPVACLDEQCGWRGYLDDELYNSWKDIKVEHKNVTNQTTREYQGRMYLKKRCGGSNDGLRN